ncbi:MAG: ABC transporter permease [Balneolaceae bacterium]|nr:ABC transporter permease [Balneolaceae bacterium]
MLANYFKIAWRNLTRNKSYALVNIGGLTVALTVFIMILLFVRHEYSYDEQLAHSDRLYRVLMHDRGSSLGESIHDQLPEPIIGQLAEQYPEVQEGVRVSQRSGHFLLRGERELYVEQWAQAGPAFLSLFDLPMLYGNPEEALSSPEQLVLTEDLAQRLFGRTDVIGESVTYQNTTEYTVSGVLHNLPTNTHFEFEALAGRQDFPADHPFYSMWNIRMANGYLLLNTEADADAFRRKLPGYVEDNIRMPEGAVGDYGLILQPVTDIHLYPQSRLAEGSRVIYIRILLAVAGLILLVACINFINLATARSAERAREIGIRKTLGAGRGQILRQISMESLITCSVAFGLSMVLVESVKPLVMGYFDVELGSLFAFSWSWLGMLAGTLLAVGLLSGAYASLYLASFRPSDILRGSGLQAGGKSTGLRKGLVVAQFGISIAIVIASLLISRQMDFIRTERLDGNDEQIMVIHNNSDRVENSFGAFRQELLRNADVESVSAGTLPNRISMRTGYRDADGGTISMSVFAVSYDYLETMGLELLEGRTFDPERSSDSTDAWILNEAAARALGHEDAVGQPINRPNGRLIGIVKNFHETTLFDPIEPVALRNIHGAGSRMSTIMVRLREDAMSPGIDQVRNTWSQFEPAFPLNYSFLDQIMDQDYRAELRLAKIFNIFSGFAIVIACLGLFGLAAYSAERRTREIGIRKVLGATAANIVTLLSSDFLKLVAVGFVIAVPAAYYGAKWWLADFAYRIDIGAGVFLLAGGAALAIALLTVSGQSLRAALANPVDSLRSE